MLSTDVIHDKLKEHPHWRIDQNALVRVDECPTYVDALDRVRAIGLMAEEINHHPDLILNYKKLTVRYWTHSAGGITEKDFEAARRVDSILGGDPQI